MKSKKETYKYIVIASLVLVVGVAILAGSSNLFQGRLKWKFNFCDLNPEGTSKVASWVPSEVVSKVTSEVTSEVTSLVASWVPSEVTSLVTSLVTSEVVSSVPSQVVSSVPCPKRPEKLNIFEKERKPFVHPSEPVTINKR